MSENSSHTSHPQTPEQQAFSFVLLGSAAVAILCWFGWHENWPVIGSLVIALSNLVLPWLDQFGLVFSAADEWRVAEVCVLISLVAFLFGMIFCHGRIARVLEDAEARTLLKRVERAKAAQERVLKQQRAAEERDYGGLAH